MDTIIMVLNKREISATLNLPAHSDCVGVTMPIILPHMLPHLAPTTTEKIANSIISATFSHSYSSDLGVFSSEVDSVSFEKTIDIIAVVFPPDYHSDKDSSSSDDVMDKKIFNDIASPCDSAIVLVALKDTSISHASLPELLELSKTPNISPPVPPADNITDITRESMTRQLIPPIIHSIRGLRKQLIIKFGW